MTYTSTDIVKENVYIVPSTLPSPLYAAVLVTAGGTTRAGGTIINGNLSSSDIDALLADSNQMNNLVHYFLQPNELIGIAATVSAATSIVDTPTVAAYDTGSYTLTATAHGLPVAAIIPMVFAGFAPAALNGVQLVTVVDADTLQITSLDLGIVDTIGTVSTLLLTATAHTLPVDAVINAQLSGFVPSSINSEVTIGVLDIDTIYAAVPYIATTIDVTNAKLQVAKFTKTAHGLPQNLLFNASIERASIASFNGIKTIVATDADTIYYAVNSASNTPTYAITSLSVVVGAVVDLMTYALSSTQNLTIGGCSPAGFNGEVSAQILTTSTFSYALVTPSWLGICTVFGKLLSTAAQELHRMGVAYFSHGTSYPVSVIELGTGGTVADLASIIALDPADFHAYAMPHGFDTVEMAALCAEYADINNLPLFIIPTLDANLPLFHGLLDVVCITPETTETNHRGGELIGQYIDNAPTAQTPLTQLCYRFCFSTPDIFTSANDPRIHYIKEQVATYVTDCAEGGITGNMWGGAFLMGANADTLPIDIMAKWIINFYKIGLDRLLAKAIIDSSNGGTPLNLNDTQGQTCINSIHAIAQGFCDAAAAAGVGEKTIIPAVNYFQWKAANMVDYTAKRYSGLIVPLSTNIGIRGIKLQIPVTFI